MRRTLSALALTVLLLGHTVPMPAQTLKTQQFPDGSGQVGVPPGWTMDAGGGAVTLAGPGGALVRLGQYQFVFSHNYDRLTLTPGVSPEVPRVYLGDPARALLDVLAHAQRQGLVSQVRLKAVEPVTGFTGRAAFLRYSFRFQGKPIEAFGLFMIAATDAQSGSFFSSSVMAPAADFGKQLPLMKAMWKSWSLSPKLLKDRLDSAAKTLGEIDMPGKLDAIQQKRRTAALAAARNFQGYIRD